MPPYHVVPWCLGCGLDDHHPDLFDAQGNLVFDSEAWDRQIIATRLGGGQLHTKDIVELLGISEQAFYKRAAYRGIKADRLDMYAVTPKIWEAEDVARIMTERAPEPPIPWCGTVGGFRHHKKVGEEVCCRCRVAESKRQARYQETRREYRRARKARQTASV